MHGDEGEEAGLIRITPNRIAKSTRPAEYLGDDVGVQASTETVEPKKKAAGRKSGARTAAKAATKQKTASARQSKRKMAKTEEEDEPMEGRTVSDELSTGKHDQEVLKTDASVVGRIYDSADDTAEDSLSDGGAVIASSEALREKKGFQAMITKLDITKPTPPRSSKLQQKRESSFLVEPRQKSKLARLSSHLSPSGDVQSSSDSLYSIKSQQDTPNAASKRRRGE